MIMHSKQILNKIKNNIKLLVFPIILQPYTKFYLPWTTCRVLVSRVTNRYLYFFFLCMARPASNFTSIHSSAGYHALSADFLLFLSQILHHVLTFPCGKLQKVYLDLLWFAKDAIRIMERSTVRSDFLSKLFYGWNSSKWDDFLCLWQSLLSVTGCSP